MKPPNNNDDMSSDRRFTRLVRAVGRHVPVISTDANNKLVRAMFIGGQCRIAVITLGARPNRLSIQGVLKAESRQKDTLMQAINRETEWTRLVDEPAGPSALLRAMTVFDEHSDPDITVDAIIPDFEHALRLIDKEDQDDPSR